MSLGKRKPEQEEYLFLAADQLPQSPGHPFYKKLNRILADNGFDVYVEQLCSKFYSGQGRPGLAPGIYFRTLLIGYFEGIDSERGIDWRCTDSLSLREFLGVPLGTATPDHSTLSVTRKRIDLETHKDVFTWVLTLLAKQGLIGGKTVGVDATTLEANAAMRSIIRRDNSQAYNAYLIELAKASGIDTPTREDLAKIDKRRQKKGSNDEWINPYDSDARITKMKDGRTHLAHKLEQAVDMEHGVVVSVTVQGANIGDTTTIRETIDQAAENLNEVRKEENAATQLKSETIEEIPADKGYHSNAVIADATDAQINTYISEPKRGKRNWEDKERERDAVLANQARIESEYGKALLRKRGELIERSFAHLLETGGMRRTHLRHHPNILKRLLVHVAAFNLGILMRIVFGYGKPRTFQDRKGAQICIIFVFWNLSVAIRNVLLKSKVQIFKTTYHIIEYNKFDPGNFFRPHLLKTSL